MKIGLTINMSVAFWANGMQQNIVFLYSLLQSIGNDCFYITQEKPKYTIHKNHKGIVLKDLLEDQSEIFDVIFVTGFDLTDAMYEALKKRNPDLKIILVHYGNKLMDDMSHGICGPDNSRLPIKKSFYIDQVWTSPHYEFSIPYLKTYYNTEKVKIAPYIWDSFFVDEKIKDLDKLNLNPFFDKNKINQVCIFEPNKTHSKNCLIPIMVCERFAQLFGDEIKSINVFCAEKIRKRQFFATLIKDLSIGQQKDYMFFNNRWSSLDACCKFGNLIVSHQIYNELNYSHLETLYLGLPLIHNSPALQDFGYYYEGMNVDMGAKQIRNAMQNHDQVLSEYKSDVSSLLKGYSLNSLENKKGYETLLNE
jgi:hypothetical protein